jgi:hypothetical protein
VAAPSAAGISFGGDRKRAARDTHGQHAGTGHTTAREAGVSWDEMDTAAKSGRTVGLTAVRQSYLLQLQYVNRRAWNKASAPDLGALSGPDVPARKRRVR